MFYSGCSSTVHLNAVSVRQIDTVNIERDKPPEHVRVVVQVASVTQHRSLRHETIEERTVVFVKPDEVFHSVAGVKVQSVELETDEAENVSVRHDALCGDWLRKNLRFPLQHFIHIFIY